MNISIDYYPRRKRYAWAALFAFLAVLAGLFSPAVSLMPLGLMAFVLAIRSEVHFDLDRRTYRSFRGIWPLDRIRRGTFADLKGVLIDRGLSGDPYSGNREYFTVHIIWVNGLERPWPIDHGRDLSEAVASAKLAAQRLGIPLVKGNGMTGLRSELERAQDQLEALEALPLKR